MKGGMMSADGRVWVKGHKSRQEMGSKTEKMILIMDMDQGYHWTLMPDMKRIANLPAGQLLSRLPAPDASSR